MFIEQRLKVQGSVVIRPTQVILHSLANGYNFAAGVGWLESAANPLEAHYAVRADGHVVQLVLETMRAEANLQANRRPDGTGAISIETDSSVPATEPWSTAQVDALVELVTAICRRHGIPARLCRSASDPGIGWHVMWGAPGAWTPVAKSCPGPARIAQVSAVIVPRVAAALRLQQQTPSSTPTVPANPAEDDMTDQDRELLKQIQEIATLAAERSLDAVKHAIEARDSGNNAASIASDVRNLITSIVIPGLDDGDSPVDPQVLADALVGRFGPAIARGVGDLLAARLAS